MAVHPIAREGSEVRLTADFEVAKDSQAGEDVIRGVVRGAIDMLTQDSGSKPGPKDMGTLMKVVQQRIFADGLRADGKQVSEIVKAELAK